MATVYWTGGAGDGNIGTDANWSSGADPGVGDTVIFDRTSQTLTGTLANSPAIVLFTENFSGSGDITLPAVTTKLVYAGSGASMKVTATGTIALAELQHSAQQVFIAAGSSTWTRITNTAGQVTVLGAAPVTTFENLAGTATLYYNSTGLTTGNFLGGRTELFRACATGVVQNGRLTQHNDGSTTTNMSAICTVYAGGVYNTRSTGTDAAVTTMPGGAFTPEGAAGDFTITTPTEYAGSSFPMVAPGVTVAGIKVYRGAVSGGGNPGITL
jgi:hypothetical protein